MNQQPILCIYHHNCADGFGAAWVVHTVYPDAEFHAGKYQAPPPDVTGRNVVIVDFSYPREVLVEMAKAAASILILDHHKSAAENLIDLPNNVTAVFDMERSGAVLTWDHYYPDRFAPRLLAHIQDRDLWQFKLPGTREIQANLFSYPYDFETWDALMAGDPADLIMGGIAIERKHHKDIAELIQVTKRSMFIGHHHVPVANLPYTMASDAGHMLAHDEVFAACYWDTEDRRVFSLRSREDGLDVSAIAQLYGGGGHKHAAGFSVPRDHPLAVL